MSIKESVNPIKKYDALSRRNINITRKLAVFIGGSNIPLSVVESEEFRELIGELDSRYEMPHTKKLSKEIDQI